MQLHNIISSKKSAVWRQLNKFQVIFSKKEIWRPKDDIQFVFLCGANIKPGVPSKRRQNLLDFSKKNLPHSKFFLAESIFTVLEKEGNTANLLDIESDLSAFSDFVVIVLESESSFCELGAFANHLDLRKKLIVINDSAHTDSPSFVNLGPIKAIKETSEDENVLYYKMESKGKEFGDGIGDTFDQLFDLIHKRPKAKRTRVENYNPAKYFSKDSFRFLHDLVYMSSPVTFSELSRILKVLFSQSNDRQLQKHLGLLCATDQIKRSDEGLFYSLYSSPFFEYGYYDITNLIASFKNLYFRYDNKRLK